MKIFLSIILFSSSLLFAQTEVPDPASFFPSTVGNVWEYSTQFGSKTIEIIKDSLDQIGNKFIFYYYFDHPDYKIDTSNDVFLIHASIDSIQYHYYRLDAKLGETWKVRSDAPGTLARVDSIFTINLWGEERCVKEIGSYRPPPPFDDTTVTEDAVYESYTLLVSGIGEFYEFDFESGPVRILKGCVIDGDTLGIITSVKQTEQEILPNEISLSQNYPNPFNPVTIIKFNIASGAKQSVTTLKVYDILGREIKTLLNKPMQPGSYEIEFNGSNLTSGVYFYVLETNGKRLSRKMLLVK